MNKCSPSILAVAALLLLSSGLFSPSPALASDSVGSIDSTAKYAWGENFGWINFAPASGNIQITDSAVTGAAWSDNFGWIKFDPTNSGQGVTNTCTGTLGGSAWSSGRGWINFSGVTINSSGLFTGQAGTLGSTAGRINFDCTNCRVTTDWRPCAGRTTTTGGGSTSSGGTSMVSPPPPPSPPTGLADQLTDQLANWRDYLLSLLGVTGNAGAGGAATPNLSAPTPETLTTLAPLALAGHLNLLSDLGGLYGYVLQPLPEDLSLLAKKFPQLQNTFNQVGLGKFGDLDRFKQVRLDLPNLTDAKDKLPSEIVFAQTSGGLINLGLFVNVTERGQVEQSISAVSHQPLTLVVKPDGPAKSVHGYLTVGSPLAPFRQTAYAFPFADLVAAPFFATTQWSQPVVSEPVVEKKLLLQQFDYTDPDHDGIYTADINTPAAAGNYEVVTVIDYQSVKLGKKELHLTTVVDPEGYVYESVNGKELLIPGALVTLSWFNPETNQWIAWPAGDYQQENPQKTDSRGTYAFLVPPGTYRLMVQAAGYRSYSGPAFTVTAGSGVHQALALQPTRAGWPGLDWRGVILIMVLVLLVFQLFRGRINQLT